MDNVLYTERRVNPMGTIVLRFQKLLDKKQETVGRSLTLQDVAYETRLAYGTVNKWAKGQVSRFDSETLATFCDYFECQPGDLLDYVPDDQEQSA